MSEFPQPVTPRAAYIHVPFCRHRCGYCNFTLVAGRDDLIGDYLRAIELELAGLGEPHEVDTLFFGGGTPTHLPAKDLARLVEIVRRWFPLAAGYEFSVQPG
jgi:oxygen-independent coproporphyrinogen-3 oxidase